MAVSIDKVYQKVLALANKEQRGYITPQEFNLFADHAQMEIFEQYFYDINQLRRVPGNDTVHSDPMDIIEDKIAAFEFFAVQANTILSNEFGDIDLRQFSDMYRLIEVRANYSGDTIDDDYVTCEEVTLKDFIKYSASPLGKQNKKRPIFMHYHHGYDRIKIYPNPPLLGNITNQFMTNGDDIQISYIKKPRKPNWAYNVINNKPLYNSTNAVDFDLHPSDETELVYRILALAGVAIEKPQLVQTAVGLGTGQIQQEKQ